MVIPLESEQAAYRDKDDNLLRINTCMENGEGAAMLNRTRDLPRRS